MDMMDDNGNDRLVARFLATAAREEMADEGFTRKVMERIEDRHARRTRMLSTAWTAVCLVGGLVLTCGMGCLSQVGQYVLALVVDIWYLSPHTLVLLPLGFSLALMVVAYVWIWREHGSLCRV